MEKHIIESNDELMHTTESSARVWPNVKDFNEMVDTTCCIISTFRGESGHKMIDKVQSLINSNPELRQFLYDFYYNTKSADRLRKVYAARK